MADDKNVVLIVAISARALAQSARRAGKAVVAIDAFGDEDAREVCRELVVAPRTCDGFRHFDLDPIVSRLVHTYDPIGIVYGAGFEDCPEQLTKLARHAPLFGAPPESVARSKNPTVFSVLCAAAGVWHPEIKLTPPPKLQEWVMKRAGGSGGLHIQNAATQSAVEADLYWQRIIKGRSISLLFSRSGTIFTPLGWSEQWTSPTPTTPYRYGGAAGPVDCRQEANVFEGLTKLAESLRLSGLASADYIDDGQRLWLLEINPRPGATLDVFDDPFDPLMAHHLCASDTTIAPRGIRKGVRASAVVYAEEDGVVSRQDWPGWIADRPPTGAIICNGAPICTVHAEAEDLPAVKSLLFERVQRAIELVGRKSE